MVMWPTLNFAHCSHEDRKTWKKTSQVLTWFKWFFQCLACYINKSFFFKFQFLYLGRVASFLLCVCGSVQGFFLFLFRNHSWWFCAGDWTGVSYMPGKHLTLYYLSNLLFFYLIIFCYSSFEKNIQNLVSRGSLVKTWGASMKWST